MGVNSLPKTVTRQHHGCDLNAGPSAPESSTLTTRLLSHPMQNIPTKNVWNIHTRAVCGCGLSVIPLHLGAVIPTNCWQIYADSLAKCVIQHWLKYPLTKPLPFPHTPIHTLPFNGPLSGTTRVGRYQKKHSPTHTHPVHQTSFINILHLKLK